MNVKILKGCRIATAQYATTGVGAPGAEKQGWGGAVGLGKKSPASTTKKRFSLGAKITHVGPKYQMIRLW
jgi:hypothetical protein